MFRRVVVGVGVGPRRRESSLLPRRKEDARSARPEGTRPPKGARGEAERIPSGKAEKQSHRKPTEEKRKIVIDAATINNSRFTMAVGSRYGAGMKRTSRPVILSAPAWRSAVKQGTAAGISRAATLRRESDGSVSFVASTAGADRYGDTIDQAGWDTASYEKNPVLLWAHSYSTPPVGRVGRLDKAGDLTARDVEFTPPEMHAFGAEVGAMVKAGFLNTVSVGFLPKQWEERRDEAGNFLGYHFRQQELLEISVVPVPANPQALVEGRAFAKSIASWADAVEPDAPPLAREYRDTIAAWVKSIDEQAQRAADDEDAAGFAEMVALLRSIDARLALLTRATEAPPLVRAAPVEDAARKPRTLSEALSHLIKPSR